MAPAWMGPPAIIARAAPACMWRAPRDPWAPLNAGVVLRVSVDGESLWTELDTGSQADLLVSGAQAARLGLHRAGSALVWGVTGIGSGATWWARGVVGIGPWQVPATIIVLPGLSGFPLLGLPPIGRLDLSLTIPPGLGDALFRLDTCRG